jgi:hypothetical protein
VDGRDAVRAIRTLLGAQMLSFLHGLGDLNTAGVCLLGLTLRRGI